MRVKKWMTEAWKKEIHVALGDTVLQMQKRFNNSTVVAIERYHQKIQIFKAYS